jgi:L-histidine Nalpha-methyltransferase
MKRTSLLRKEVDADPDASVRQFAHHVFSGLSRSAKRLSSKYIYDEAGSRLFSRITELPEYYPTACETEIFERHKSLLSKLFGQTACNIVELGAGDGRKTRILIEELLGRTCDFTYVPIDISGAAVDDLSNRFSRHYPGLCIRGIVSDYFAGLKWLANQNHRRKIVLFLGSTIGNFGPLSRLAFLENLRRSIDKGDLVLIGFDLVKDIDIIVRAYNDAQGVTADFNKNILHRINRELDGDFKPDRFRYLSFWDGSSSAIQSYLISARRQQVHIGKLDYTFAFDAWESIHTESSHKFTPTQIAGMAVETGFVVEAEYYDSRQFFVDSLWRAV